MPYQAIDAEVIRRIVCADAAYTTFNARRSLRARDTSIERRDVQDAIALRDHARPERYYNRILGLGHASASRLGALATFHHDIGLACTVALTPDRATPDVVDALRRHRFHLSEQHTIFACHRSTEAAAPRTQIQTRRATPQDLDVIVKLWQQDATTPIAPEVIAKRAAAQWEPEFHIFLAERSGDVVAMASMFLCEGIAWLGNAETLRAHQGQGCQGALLHRRLEAAWAMRCDWAVSDADFGSVSHRNIERAGMRMAYIEAWLTAPAPETTTEPF